MRIFSAISKSTLNFKLIAKVIGSLLFIEAFLMGITLTVSLLNGGVDSFAFLVTILITFISGFLLRHWGQPENESMNRREAYLLISLTWIVFTIFGSLPFMISGYITNFTDAFFETMSGFTTTGSSVIDNIDRFPKGLILWRTMTQWIGGLGIVFFTIAILPGLVSSGNVRLFTAEATGPLRAKMHPKLSTNAKRIILVYLALTAGCAFLFDIEGMTPFDSINYSMTTTATGGFSPHTQSISYYGSSAIDYTTIFFMFFSGVNFTLLYLAIAKRQWRNMLSNSEFHIYLKLTLFATAIIALFLYFGKTNYGILDSIRNSLFQVVSFITTTGVFNDNAYDWPRFTWFILTVVMFTGGCAGSTSGGIKCIRIVMLVKLVRNEMMKLLHPKAVLSLKINNNHVASHQQVSLLVFLVVYFLLCIITYSILMLFDGHWIDTVDAISISISSASNVGPALGSPLDNTDSWVGLSAPSKWCCSFLMLMGRLEILSVLVIFFPAFWKENN